MIVKCTENRQRGESLKRKNSHGTFFQIPSKRKYQSYKQAYNVKCTCHSLKSLSWRYKAKARRIVRKFAQFDTLGASSCVEYRPCSQSNNLSNPNPNHNPVGLWAMFAGKSNSLFYFFLLLTGSKPEIQNIEQSLK